MINAEQIVAGTTSKRIDVFLGDSSSTIGGGLTGLTNASTNLVCYYSREDDGNVGGTQITLNSMTRGTWATGGFVEKDATNMPGIYEFSIPDAVLASGAKWAKIYFRDTGSALNLIPTVVDIQLPVFNIYSASVTLATQQVFIKKNAAMAGFSFPMFDSSGALKTLLTVTAQRVLDGGAVASMANSVTEISAGLYKIDIAAADSNCSSGNWIFTATGALPTVYSFVTQP